MDLQVETSGVLEENLSEKCVDLVSCDSLEGSDQLLFSIKVEVTLLDLEHVLVTLHAKIGVLLLDKTYDAELHGLNTLFSEWCVLLAEPIEEVVDSVFKIVCILAA